MKKQTEMARFSVKLKNSDIPSLLIRFILQRLEGAGFKSISFSFTS